MRASISWNWAILVTLALPACNDEPTGPPSGPTTIVAVSGDGVVSEAGRPLSFRVAVSAGDTPAPRATIVWHVTSGEGLFQISPSLTGPIGDAELVGSTTDFTDRAGMAQVSFVPTVVGVSVVTATATTDAGAVVGSVDFSTEARALVIAVGGVVVDWASSWPFGPQGATVPVGTPVEWSMYTDWGWGLPGRVRSTSVPPGGETFESPVMDDGQGFEFVPTVPGTWVWEFDDGQVTESATLIVR